MYCAGCGNEVGDSDAFCGRCGRPLAGGPPQMAIDGKDEAVALVLGAIVPGLGIMYSGRFREGMSYLIAAALFAVASFAVLLHVGTDVAAMEAFSGILLLTAMATLALHLFAAYAGYGYAKEYNEALRSEGGPPW
ncbi:MAG: zinc ribbon domain-containing protein [Thermoplasmatales archaeon]|mgnify:CR=1 FL=1|nr:zinc ribbon domain-containing protein [Thermoplasmatales archaeon]